MYGMAVKNEGRVAATAVTGRVDRSSCVREVGAPEKKRRVEAKYSPRNAHSVSAPWTAMEESVIDAGPEGKTEVGGTVRCARKRRKRWRGHSSGRYRGSVRGRSRLADGDSGGENRRRIAGGDAELDNSSSVTIGSGAQISADALISGDGGTVIVFAEGTLHFRGQASVNGGVFGGNGGFVELSGKQSLFVDDLVK